MEPREMRISRGRITVGGMSILLRIHPPDSQGPTRENNSEVGTHRCRHRLGHPYLRLAPTSTHPEGGDARTNGISPSGNLARRTAPRIQGDHNLDTEDWGHRGPFHRGFRRTLSLTSRIPPPDSCPRLGA